MVAILSTTTSNGVSAQYLGSIQRYALLPADTWFRIEWYHNPACMLVGLCPEVVGYTVEIVDNSDPYSTIETPISIPYTGEDYSGVIVDDAEPGHFYSVFVWMEMYDGSRYSSGLVYSFRTLDSMLCGNQEATAAFFSAEMYTSLGIQDSYTFCGSTWYRYFLITDNSNYGGRAGIFVNPTTREVVVAFEGTSDFSDVITYLTGAVAFPCQLIYGSNSDCQGQVMLGIGASYVNLRDRDDLDPYMLLEYLSTLIYQESPDAPYLHIIYTGHSKGGLEATYGAADAVIYLSDPDVIVHCVTFGSPTPGTSSFVSWWNNIMGLNIPGNSLASVRYVHYDHDANFLALDADPVVALSPSLYQTGTTSTYMDSLEYCGYTGADCHSMLVDGGLEITSSTGVGQGYYFVATNDPSLRVQYRPVAFPAYPPISYSWIPVFTISYNWWWFTFVPQSSWWWWWGSGSWSWWWNSTAGGSWSSWWWNFSSFASFNIDSSTDSSNAALATAVVYIYHLIVPLSFALLSVFY